MTPHQHAGPPGACPFCASEGAMLPLPGGLTDEDRAKLGAIAKAYLEAEREWSRPPTVVLVSHGTFSRPVGSLFGQLEVRYSSAIEPGCAVLVRDDVAVTI